MSQLYFAKWKQSPKQENKIKINLLFTNMDKNLNENERVTYQSNNKENQIRIFELILSFSNAQTLTMQKNNPTFPCYLADIW